MKTLLITFLLAFSSFAFAHEQIDRILAVYPDTTKFIVADKELGTIYVVDPITKAITEAPALYGKMPIDKINMGYYDRKDGGNPYITPAGMFTVTKMYSTELKRHLLVFFEGSFMVMAIHAVYTGNPVQMRPQRLMSNDPAMKKITNGCINVPGDFFSDELFTLSNGTRLYILPETSAAKIEWAKIFPPVN